jgi:hypothetical protein
MVALYLALSIPAFNFLGALSSLLAAFHWYRASQVKDPRGASRLLWLGWSRQRTERWRRRNTAG